MSQLGTINNEFAKPSTYKYILDLQATTDFDKLWEVFLDAEAVAKVGTILEAKLVYRAGIYFKSLEYTRAAKTQRTESGGKKIKEKKLEKFTFLESEKPFDYRQNGNEWVFIQQGDNYWGQLEFRFKEDIGTGIKGLLALVHIFCNQLFLLLRIHNCEYHSIKDDITQAYNQKYLRTFIRNEIERANRFTSVFSLIFFDLDNLKAVNELHGHLVGTEVLQEVAEILRENIRKIDILSRFGGDEFVIVLLHADAGKAYEACERIRDKVNNFKFLKNKGLDLHISGCFGISSFPRDGETGDDLIRKADMAMYEVKHKGKDGIRIYGQPAGKNGWEKREKEK